MHPNQAFRKADAARNISFARSRSFGSLCVNSDNGPLMSHIPFKLSKDGDLIELHLVRSNPILRLLDPPAPALIAVTGPDSYISPDWYDTEDQVPTWNYVAVHLRGTLRRLAQDELPGVLERLSAQFEEQLLPKIPWSQQKMTPEALAKMMRMIVPCRFDVSQIDGTWKLNQNKEDAARLGAARAVAEHGIGSELQALAALMQDPPD